MQLVAILLILGVFVRHVAISPIAEAIGMTPQAVSYMLGGAWEVVLCGVIFLFAFGMKASVWRSLVRGAASIGMIEGAQMPVCRLAINDITKVPKGADLCDYVAGFPVGKPMMILYFLILVWVLGHAKPAA